MKGGEEGVGKTMMVAKVEVVNVVEGKKIENIVGADGEDNDYYFIFGMSPNIFKFHNTGPNSIKSSLQA